MPRKVSEGFVLMLWTMGFLLCFNGAGREGNFELNAMRPIIINNFLHSARILGDACEKLRHFSVEGTRLNRQRIDEMLGRSLMLVTALRPRIGDDKAATM